MATRYCFTLNNYTPEECVSLQHLDVAYMVFGREIGTVGLTMHLQGYVIFKSRKSLMQVRAMLSRAHWEVAKGTTEQNVVYCTKAGEFTEIGVRPMSQSEKGSKGGEKSKEVWKAHWELAKLGQFEELPPAQIKTWEYIRSKYGSAPTDRTELLNEWIHGPSGCGKSRYVRDTYPVFYSKPMSKWWDGYAGEPVVVLDDFAPEHGKFLGYFLKIWADHYVFNAEVKGSMLRIRPDRIIVTSQYSLEACFEEGETIAALLRRFNVTTMPGPNPVLSCNLTGQLS